MKKSQIGTVFAVAFLASIGGAAAQDQAVTLSIDDQNKIQEWVVKEKKASMPVPAGFTLVVGASLPDTIRLETFPAEADVASASKFRYAIINGKTVLVEPGTRKIVHIIG